MTGKPKRVTLVVGAAALLCLGAYASLSYMLAPAVVDSGGGHASSTGYQLDASIGGPVALTSAAAPDGEASSTNYTLQVTCVSLLDQPTAPAAGGGGGGGGCSPTGGTGLAR